MNEQGFDVLTEELQGKKLIEASAGTGKTYSIAILVLRIILEKGIPIEKILMVTFTKAAVAELETRIRKFIRTGYKYMLGREDLDEGDNIRIVIDNADRRAEEKKDLLSNAVQSLDNLSVMTIHGFCQKTIEEFTFETNQSFDFEIVTDDTDLLKNESNRYLREVLNVLNLETFRGLKENLEFEKMHELLSKHLLGMEFIDSRLNEDSTIEELKQEIVSKKEDLDSFIENKFTEIISLGMKNALVNEAKAGNVKEFKRRFRDQIKKPAGYFDNFDFMRSDFLELEKGIKYAETEFINHFYLDFFRRADEEIKNIKQNRGYISYNDQIKTVNGVSKNKIFSEKLLEKYQAIFIDEFQDTDKHQYEIFKNVFSNYSPESSTNQIIYYIGDPKQSIYGWRGADLDTYKKAKSNIDGSPLILKRNFRSTQNMIDALNILLNPGEDFNMFDDDEIRYENVIQGASDLGKMTDNGKDVIPITILKFDENDEKTNFRAVAQEVYRLLDEDVKIKGIKIKPNDIGVLVRDNREGDEIKKLLAEFNIPVVKRDDKKVLDSEEARMIKYLLKAVIFPRRGDINRALLSPWYGFNHETIKTIDDEEHLEIFRRLKKILAEAGVYNMISSFLTEYGVRSTCMEDVLGQRVLTNISQIAELLHKVEKQLKYTLDELLVWMERSSEDGDEDFEQRIESDENAVQVSTIHKAKGLEYKIVFAPGLCMIPKFKLREKNRVNDFKKEGEYYFTFNYPALTEEDKALHDRQKEQENRRLIYVALTRVVYKCYISYMPRAYRDKPKESSLDDIYSKYTGNSPDLIHIEDFANEEFSNTSGKYDPTEDDIREFSPRVTPEIEIKNTFGIHSFSGLSRAHHTAPFEKVGLGEPDNYDQFIFQDLPRGANVGTALHSIFEYLDFNHPDTWDQTLKDASKYYPNIIREESLDLFKQMVNHVMKIEIRCDGESLRLEEIRLEQMLPELEFYFSLDKVNKTVINDLLGEEADLSGEVDIEGLMTGFIDLVFEYSGKYYILDWKSNHLGNAIEKYDKDGLDEAMSGSNYNLQYMIYTVAIKRWLESRIPNFDYDKQFGGIIYVFLRGVRDNQQTGIFTAKPGMEVIEILDSAL